MKRTVLEQALCMMRARGDWSKEELKNIDDALDEVAESKKLNAPNNDIWDDEVYLVSIEDATTVGNRMLYDMYGRMMRQNRNLVEFDLFEMACRGGSVDCSGFEHWPKSALHACWEIIADLWYTNESQGLNKSTGEYVGE
jgi:hypothetical protein